MPFVAGDRHMRYQKFLLFNALGCFAWASVYVSLGFGAGESWRMAAEWVGFTGKLVGSGLLLTVALVWFWRWRGRRSIRA
jgi:membrane protein DedA with SNARE-associated domain